MSLPVYGKTDANKRKNILHITPINLALYPKEVAGELRPHLKIPV